MFALQFSPFHHNPTEPRRYAETAICRSFEQIDKLRFLAFLPKSALLEEPRFAPNPVFSMRYENVLCHSERPALMAQGEGIS